MAIDPGGSGSFKVKIKDTNNQVYYFAKNGDGDLNPIQCRPDMAGAFEFTGIGSDPTTWTTSSTTHLGYDASTSPPRVHGTSTSSVEASRWRLVTQDAKQYLAYDVGGNRHYVYCNTSNNNFAAFTTILGKADPISIVIMADE